MSTAQPSEGSPTSPKGLSRHSTCVAAAVEAGDTAHSTLSWSAKQFQPSSRETPGRRAPIHYSTTIALGTAGLIIKKYRDKTSKRKPSRQPLGVSCITFFLIGRIVNPPRMMAASVLAGVQWSAKVAVTTLPQSRVCPPRDVLLIVGRAFV